MKEWKWKSTIIDFNSISDEKSDYSDYLTKKEEVFHYLGIPDDDIHKWENGKYSSEYNTALRYAKELGLVEDYVDYEEIRYQNSEKDKEIERLNNIIDELEKDLIKVRQITFDKYNSNEWNNCLSFNDDIKPILDKLKELKEGDNND